MSYLAHLVGDQSKFDAFLRVSMGRYRVEVPGHAEPHGRDPGHRGTLGRDPGQDGLSRVSEEVEVGMVMVGMR